VSITDDDHNPQRIANCLDVFYTRASRYPEWQAAPLYFLRTKRAISRLSDMIASRE